jgi:hypothetical protein
MGPYIRLVTITFQPGSIDNDFGSTIQCLFDLMDPRFDARLESNTPLVHIVFINGLEGLRRFLPMVRTLGSSHNTSSSSFVQLEPLLPKNLALDIELSVVERSLLPVDATKGLATLFGFQDEQLIDMMRGIAHTYANLWKEIRPYRRLENIPPSYCIVLEVKVQFISPGSETVCRELQGELEDREDDEARDAEPRRYVAASRVSLDTRQTRILWEKHLVGDLLPMS